MIEKTATMALGLATALALAAPAAGQQAIDESQPQARVWFDQGDEPVVERGDRVRIYYRTSRDAYVAVIHIDTDGTANLVFPRSPEENHYVRGDRDYRLLFPRSPYWLVDDPEGVGYFFLVASPEPFDFSEIPYSYYDGGWDLRQVGRRVYQDPYVAMDEYVASLVPDWEVVPYALDFATYHVDARHDYPRFLCYDCHGFQPYSAWNPYYATCTTFQVVIYDDPYYYPARRYRGRNVVWARPPLPYQPRYAFKERAEGDRGVAVVQRRPSPTLQDVYDRSRRQGGGTPPAVTGRTPDDAQRPPVVRWRDPAGGGAGGTASPRDEPRRPAVTPAGPTRRPAAGSTPAGGTPAPTSVPSTTRRPADAVRPGGAPSPATGAPNRPVLRRRPSGGSDGGAATDRGEGRASGPIRVIGPRPDRTRPATPVTGSGVSPATPSRPSGRPDAGSSPSTPTRPTAQPRGGASTGSPDPSPTRPTARPSGSGSGSTRPSARPGGTSGSRPSARAGDGSSTGPAARPRSGGVARSPTRSGGSPSSRPTVRVRGSSGSAPVRSGGSSGARAPTRAPARPSGGNARPPTRPSGGSARPPARPSGGSARPPARPSGGSSRPSGGSARPAPRSGGSGSAPSARPRGGSSGGGARPPVRRPGGSARPGGA